MPEMGAGSPSSPSSPWLSPLGLVIDRMHVCMRVHTHTHTDTHPPATATLLADSPVHGEACRLPAEDVRRVCVPTCRQSLALQKGAVAQAHAVTRGSGSRSIPSAGPAQTSGRQRWQRGEEGARSTGASPLQGRPLCQQVSWAGGHGVTEGADYRLRGIFSL